MNSPLSPITMRITSFINGIKRRSSIKKKSTKKNDSKYGARNGVLLEIRRIFTRKILAFSSIVVLIFVFIFTLIQYFSTNFVPYSIDEISHLEIINSSSLNLAFYIYSESDVVGEEGYRYLEMISVISNTNNSNRIFSINPDFLVNVEGEERQFSTLLNLWPENELMPLVNEAVEKSLGVRIDRYLIVEKNALGNFISNNLSEDLFHKYQIGFEESDHTADEVIEAHVAFFESLTKDNASFGAKVKLFWKLDELANIIKTDISKNEIYFLDRLLANEIKVSDYLKEELGILVSSESGSFFRINQILLDDNLRKVFQDLRVISEQCELEVYNSSDISGFALKKTREFKNIGINVVKYGNFVEDLEEENHIIYIDSDEDLEKYRYTIESIRQSLRGKVTIKIGEYEYNKTGNVVMVLVNN